MNHEPLDGEVPGRVSKLLKRLQALGRSAIFAPDLFSEFLLRPESWLQSLPYFAGPQCNTMCPVDSATAINLVSRCDSRPHEPARFMEYTTEYPYTRNMRITYLAP
jgi:hypothetical protein